MATELKSYTIVPDSLYVERKADKQLHNIVEAMQRPGYVLVSRQMGKTNLLLRAKRKWENSDDLFVYIDMSNIDETEKDCFESLIDTAIDTHEEILGHLRDKIEDLRKKNIIKSPVQAHNEELRLLLKSVKGKLVFILDEIDSLTRTTFSDNIFSQIRSTYFSRVNYPVLEKLTYVLSGVVEPTEIIKNPKISPFNIGEKIHLDDFSHEEYLTFLNKADLNWLGNEVIERIYYWASGNPRMTWDICYELQHSKDQTSQKVDSLVKNMYLTSYDKVPIDTIRTLVKEDRDLRDAIIQLAYDKGNTLSDKIKSKLYLAGIVNYNENDVKIKNRIIKESLSLNWLQKVEEEEKGLLTYAIELHGKGFYQESLNKFEIFLKNNDFPEANAAIYYYCMGSCYYHLNDYEKSLEYLTKETIDPQTSPYDYRHENFLSGADCLKLGRYSDALGFFENTMRGDARDWLYYSAKLNSLTAKQRVAKGDDEAITQIENDYKGLLSIPDDLGINDVKLYASYQLAVLIGVERKEDACKYFDIALSYAGEAAKPRVLAEKFYVVSDEQQTVILSELVSSIVGLNQLNDTSDPDKALDMDEETLIKVLYIIYYYAPNRWQEVNRRTELLPYTYGDVLFMMFVHAFYVPDFDGEGAQRLIRELLLNLHSDDYNLSPEYHLQVYKFNAFLVLTEESSIDYLKALKKTDDIIDSVGLVVVRNYAWTLFQKKKYRQLVDELSWITDRYPDSLSHQDAVTRSLFDYALLMSYFSLSEIRLASEIGKMILSYVDEEMRDANVHNKDTLLQVKRAAQQIVSIATPREPVRIGKTYGRNDKVFVRYINANQVVEKKFKQIEGDLANGYCIIVEE